MFQEWLKAKCRFFDYSRDRAKGGAEKKHSGLLLRMTAYMKHAPNRMGARSG